MVNSKRLISGLLCVFFFTTLYAQDVKEAKKEFNNIKKNPEYIYGQSSGEDEGKCYEIAYEEFLVKLKEYIAADEALNNASAVIVQKMQKSVKKISFERYLNCKVVCVYINKNDIKPVRKSDIIDTTRVAVPVIINSVVEQKTDTAEATPPAAPATVSEATASDKTAAPSTPQQTASPTSQQPISQPDINARNAKEDEILKELCSLKKFPAIMEYLNNRKAASHDVVFKATTQYGSIVNAYWLVFDKDKTLIAILTRDKTSNILTNTSANSKEYSNSPKVWLQIY